MEVVGMEYKGRTVVSVEWFHCLGRQTGIVVCEKKEGDKVKRKAYIGAVQSGVSEEADVKTIIDYGTKLRAESVSRLVGLD